MPERWPVCLDELDLYEAAGAYIADNVVPATLHAEVVHLFTTVLLVTSLKHFQIVRKLDALAALEPKDYHLGSGGKVQDLIHPSLCKAFLLSCRYQSQLVKIYRPIQG